MASGPFPSATRPGRGAGLASGPGSRARLTSPGGDHHPTSTKVPGARALPSAPLGTHRSPSVACPRLAQVSNWACAPEEPRSRAFSFRVPAPRLPGFPSARIVATVQALLVPVAPLPGSPSGSGPGRRREECGGRSGRSAPRPSAAAAERPRAGRACAAASARPALHPAERALTPQVTRAGRPRAGVAPRALLAPRVLYA